MSERPAIPEEIKMKILIESGHRCAVCGTPSPLEFAHIIPWNKVKEHKVENLICLCANCHRRCDKEKWGKKALYKYKKNPWIEKNLIAKKHKKSTIEQESIENRGTLKSSVPGKYKTIIDKVTENFIGRDHVFKFIDNFLNKKSAGYLLIKGDPGIGKTALLSEFVKRNNCFFYIIERNKPGNRQVIDFLKSLCKQLNLFYNISSNSMSEDPYKLANLLNDILSIISKNFNENEKVIIAIDALDEMNSPHAYPGSNILLLPRFLPNSIYFILTCRKIEIPLNVQTTLLEFDLMQYKKENENDIKRYITKQIETLHGLKKWIKKNNLSKEKFISLFTEKSQMNFMYLFHILPGIANGLYVDLNIKNLPEGLKGYYRMHWEIMKIKYSDLFYLKVKILYILARSMEPVSRKMISDYIKENELEIQNILNDWLQFLHKTDENPPRYRIYHNSFREFLEQNETVQAGKSIINDVDKIIGDKLMQTYLNVEIENDN